MNLYTETTDRLLADRRDAAIQFSIKARALELIAAGFTVLEALNEAEIQIYAEIDAGRGLSRPDYDRSEFGVED